MNVESKTGIPAVAGADIRREVPIAEVHESPWNPRQHFSTKSLEAMAESIRQVGIVEPLIVRPRLLGGYELGSGHRRRRGALLAGLETVPVLVRELPDAEFLELLTIGNLHRVDLHPLEEADGFQVFIRESGKTMEQLAEKIGMSLSHVSGRIKLLGLTDAAKLRFRDGEFSASHAVLMSRRTPRDQAAILKFLAPIPGEVETAVSEKALRRWIRDNLDLRLERVPFPLEDATLVADAGACNGCSKRTASDPAVFEDAGREDLCMDGACYKLKQNAHLDRLETEWKDRGQEVVRISIGYNRGKGLLNPSEYREVSANATGPNVKTGIAVDGPLAGKAIRIQVKQPETPAPSAKPAEPKVSAATQKAAEEEKQAKRAEEEKLRLRVLAAVLERVTWPPKPEDLRRVLADSILNGQWGDVFSERYLGENRRFPGAAQVDAYLAKAKPNDLARLLVHAAVADEVHDFYDATSKCDELTALAKRYRVDPQKVRNGEAAAPKKAATPAKKKTAPPARRSGKAK